MTRIDFHSNIGDKITYACRLARKIQASRHRIILLTGDDQGRSALDHALWTFSELDFLPHVMTGDVLAPRTPIVLADQHAADFPHHQILINLSGATPGQFARFERMIEIVGRDDAEVASGRERWLFYKQRGYHLNHFAIEGP